MLPYFILWKILFISVTCTGNISPSETNTTTPLTNKQNFTKVTIVSEGGSMVTDGPVLGLSRENHTILLSLDKELGYSKEKPVKPRKGVEFYNTSEEVSEQLNLHKDLQNKSQTIVPTPKVSTTITQNNTTTNKTEIKADVQVTEPVNKKKKNETVTKKKPKLLSYEALSDTGKSFEVKLPVIQSSSKPVSDQIPSPNKNFELPTRNPGMVIPIVVTILVVPVIAVLGYMGLKRGKEAWKNRHYKRMDFLLDGMYNE